MARKISGRWDRMKSSDNYEVEIPVNKRPAMVLERYNNPSLKTDVEILSYANWYCSMNYPTFLISNDNDFLFMCRELKSQENRSTLDCGRLEDFIRYLERINGNEMKSIIEGLKEILRRAKDLREIQKNLEFQTQMEGSNGFPTGISLESPGAGEISSQVKTTFLSD